MKLQPIPNPNNQQKPNNNGEIPKNHPVDIMALILIKSGPISVGIMVHMPENSNTMPYFKRLVSTLLIHVLLKYRANAIYHTMRIYGKITPEHHYTHTCSGSIQYLTIRNVWYTHHQMRSNIVFHKAKN